MNVACNAQSEPEATIGFCGFGSALKKRVHVNIEPEFVKHGTVVQLFKGDATNGDCASGGFVGKDGQQVKVRGRWGRGYRSGDAVDVVYALLGVRIH